MKEFYKNIYKIKSLTKPQIIKKWVKIIMKTFSFCYFIIILGLILFYLSPIYIIYLIFIRK